MASSILDMNSSGGVFLDSNLLTVTTKPRRSGSYHSRKMSSITQHTSRRLNSVSTASVSTGPVAQPKSRYSTYEPGNSLYSFQQSVTPKSFENTYKLGPTADEQPLVRVVKDVVSDVIKESVNTLDYEKELSGKLACDLSVIIKQRVKRCLPCARYKVTCTVLVTQPVGQGFQTSSRCLWNEKTDSYTSVVYENKKIHIEAIIHWVYFD